MAIVVSGEGQGELGLQSINTFLEAYHGIKIVDSIIAEGVTPCYVCGEGENCELSCVRARYGADVTITPDIIPSLDRQYQVIESLRYTTTPLL